MQSALEAAAASRARAACSRVRSACRSSCRDEPDDEVRHGRSAPRSIWHDVRVGVRGARRCGSARAWSSPTRAPACFIDEFVFRRQSVREGAHRRARRRTARRAPRTFGDACRTIRSASRRREPMAEKPFARAVAQGRNRRPRWRADFSVHGRRRGTRSRGASSRLPWARLGHVRRGQRRVAAWTSNLLRRAHGPARDRCSGARSCRRAEPCCFHTPSRTTRDPRPAGRRRAARVQPEVLRTSGCVVTSRPTRPHGLPVPRRRVRGARRRRARGSAATPSRGSRSRSAPTA